jgi:hypothetical protein
MMRDDLTAPSWQEGGLSPRDRNHLHQLGYSRDHCRISFWIVTLTQSATRESEKGWQKKQGKRRY